MTLPRIAVVCDYREENWPSMDLVGDMLLDRLTDEHANAFGATRIAPAMHRRFTRNGLRNGNRFNADRMLNRFWDYPRVLRSRRNEFDLFHVVDHSYAQLVHELPAERTVLTCHDLDAFRCVLNGNEERRSLVFKRLTRRILGGLRQAARVTCDSAATRDDLLAYSLVSADRAVVVPNGVHPACKPEPNSRADAAAARLLGEGDSVELLHVGSTVGRKRIDILLKTFAAVRRQKPDVRLIRAGGRFTPAQAALAEELGVSDAVVILPNLDREMLAAVYRRAAIVLQPSEREGFGLPVIEAMACGTPVVASDIAVLREVGGDAAVYCALEDVNAWAAQIVGLLTERHASPENWSARRAAGVAHASQYSWSAYASKMVEIYRELL